MLVGVLVLLVMALLRAEAGVTGVTGDDIGDVIVLMESRESVFLGVRQGSEGNIVPCTFLDVR